MAIQRYFIQLSYNGKSYRGWQKQPNAPSIQATLEHTLSILLGTPIAVIGAGRTDAGVHAEEMYAHFDLLLRLPENICQRLNAFLPRDIVIKKLLKVRPDAHARFDALSRHYRYQINRSKDPFSYDYAYLYSHPLDIEQMNTAAKVLLEEKHFQCFSKSRTDVKTDICDIQSAYWQINNNQLIFHITANRFLRNMVRAIVGTLLNVGIGKTTIEDFKKIIDSKDRGQSGVSVAAQGLYLTKIEYPLEIFL